MSQSTRVLVGVTFYKANLNRLGDTPLPEEPLRSFPLSLSVRAESLTVASGSTHFEAPSSLPPLFSSLPLLSHLGSGPGRQGVCTGLGCPSPRCLCGSQSLSSVRSYMSPSSGGTSLPTLPQTATFPRCLLPFLHSTRYFFPFSFSVFFRWNLSSGKSRGTFCVAI